MIIQTFSDTETKIAQGIVTALRAAEQEVIFVPHRVKELFITTDGSEELELMVIASDGAEDLHIATGFESVKDCWNYAKEIAAIAGLPEENIDADVWEVKIFTGKFDRTNHSNLYVIANDENSTIHELHEGDEIEVLNNGEWIRGFYIVRDQMDVTGSIYNIPLGNQIRLRK